MFQLRLLVLTLLALCPAFASAEVFNVKTAPIEYKQVEQKIRTFGVLAPSVEELSFQIPGRISEFSAEEGERVSKGQLLVSLDTRDATDAVRKARTELDNTSRVRERMLKLHETGSIQESQLDDVEAQYQQSKINFEQAELALERSRLLAPSDGLLLMQNIDSRTSVKPGQTVFIFQSDAEKWVTRVDLTDINALGLDATATAAVTFAPYPNTVFKGEVSKVAQVANRSDGLYTTEIVISNEGYELRPGMVAEVDLLKVSPNFYSIVPFDALLELRKNRGVIFLVSEDRQTARRYPVTIFHINREQVAVHEDLRDFSEVVTHGHRNLTNGAAIRVLNDQ